jgi:glutamyl-tRNA synthetase
MTMPEKNLQQEIRVRFAPSPTGDLHLGNVRTALYNWLFSKHFDGKFILRVEDTDKVRSTEQAFENLLQIMKWLDLKWDEGPVIGGPFEPYRQSERTEIYKKYLNQLEKMELVYPCFCSEEELELERKRQLGRGQMPKYGGKCFHLTEQERANLKNQKKPFVLRFQVRTGEIRFMDAIRGEVVFPQDQIGDFVLTRTDGSPTYNFTVVVDDALMKITHVIRGEDHLSNTPKQILIYEALGFNPPKFAHLSIIKGADGQKLSKRHGETSAEFYRSKGYRSDAFLNYLALLGWSPAKGEILSLDEMIQEFDLSRMGKSGAIFDHQKLRWMGGQYISKMLLDELTRCVLPFLEDAHLLNRTWVRDQFEWLKEVVDLVRGHLCCYSDIIYETFYFFSDELNFSPEQSEELQAQKELLLNFYNEFQEVFEKEALNQENFFKVMKSVSTKTEKKRQALYHPLRLALTGRNDGPELIKIAILLKNKKILERLNLWITETDSV